MKLEFPLTIAYNMREKKIGCVLLQPAMGATLPSGVVSSLFDTDSWELNASKLKMYTLHSQEEFDFMVKVTKEAREHEQTLRRNMQNRSGDQMLQVPNCRP